MDWKDLVKTCILGTANRPIDTDWKALEPYGFQPSAKVNDNVLQAAASYSLLRKAGRVVPLAKAPATQSCSSTERLACSATSRMHLRGILKANQSDLLFEFLELAQRVRCELPPELLPALLDWGAKQPEWQSLLRIVAAPRGRWLAQWKPTWDYMQTEIDQDRWELGKKEERLRLFRRWRQQEPQQAREALEAIWEKESLPLRLRFLKMFKWALNASDIPFLEKCLTESRKELREVAADLLSKLPQSPLIQRMEARCKALITWKQQRLEVELPEKLDAFMQRDGIQAQLQWFQGGLRASRLGQMLAVIPPSYWEKELNLSAADLLQAALEQEWRDYLLLAWAKAAARHRNQDWLSAFFRLYAQSPHEDRWERLSIDFIFEKLDTTVLNALALEQLEENQHLLSDESPVIKLLLLENHRWKNELSLKIIKCLHQVIKSDNYVFHWGLKSVLKRAAYAVDPKLQERLSQDWPEHSRLWHSWQMDVNDFLTTLQFRKDMRAALLAVK